MIMSSISDVHFPRSNRSITWYTHNERMRVTDILCGFISLTAWNSRTTPILVENLAAVQIICPRKEQPVVLKLEMTVLHWEQRPRSTEPSRSSQRLPDVVCSTLQHVLSRSRSPFWASNVPETRRERGPTAHNRWKPENGWWTVDGVANEKQWRPCGSVFLAREA